MDWQKVLAWLKRHGQTFDLFPEYLEALYGRWNDYFFEAVLLAPVVVWWMLGSPPMWLVVSAFVVALIVAGYYAWRDEHLKLLGPAFKCWVYGIDIMSDRVFVGIRITNVGPQTSLHGWQAGHQQPDGRGVVYLEGALIQETNLSPPLGINGGNLRGDYRIFQTGETREGWIAFPVGPMAGAQTALEATKLIAETASVSFYDAFDRKHEVPSLRSWISNPKAA